MMTRLQQMLIDKYPPEGVERKADEMVLLAVGMGAKEFGFEDEIIAYLEDHPSATLQELDAFAKPFFPEIVIEED